MGRELAERAQGAPTSLAQLIDRMRPEMARALPAHMNADRMARIATTLLRQTPKLGQCTQESFLGALMTCAQLGLEPGPLGEAYLVPYGNVVTFIPGYRGLIKLAYQSGQLQNIDAHVVHDGDDFEYEYGLTPVLRHRPARGNPGATIAVYAVATLKDGGSAFVVMSVDDVEAIRARSRAGKNGPWVTDWDAMARKSCIKQLVKFLPLSTEMHQLALAAHLDGSTRTDIGFPIADAEATWVEDQPAEITNRDDEITEPDA